MYLHKIIYTLFDHIGNSIIKNIRNRYADFISGSIKECYIVLKNKAVKIPSDLFSGVTNQKKAKKVEAKIHKLLTSTFFIVDRD